MFVKLTGPSGNPIFINMDRVELMGGNQPLPRVMDSSGLWTRLQYNDGESYVKETPEEILAMIKSPNMIDVYSVVRQEIDAQCANVDPSDKYCDLRHHAGPLAIGIADAIRKAAR